MKQQITEKLTALARQENIYFLLAVESGSRAWGFPSFDSDYDVRAIFIRPQKDYLQIFHSTENISFIENAWFDVSCWDILKASRLIFNSNMTLFEWLQSPIIYQADAIFAAEMLTLAKTYFQPAAGLRHYRGIAKNIWPKINLSTEVKLKKWLYLLRSLLAADWIGQGNGVPPMTLNALMADLAPTTTKEQITEIIIRKAKQQEVNEEKLSLELQKFTHHLWQRVESYYFPRPANPDPSALNQYFQLTLARLAHVDY